MHNSRNLEDIKEKQSAIYMTKGVSLKLNVNIAQTCSLEASIYLGIKENHQN